MSKYAVINSSVLTSLDLSELQDTSLETVRRSLDETKCIVEYTGSMPSALQNLNPTPTELTEGEAITLMATADWYVADELDLI